MATGPNTPGADTTGGNVDKGGYLSAPIIGCASDLQIDKDNDLGWNGFVGTPFNWILTVTNDGYTNGKFNAGQTILVDDLTPGTSYGTPVVGDFDDITNSANIYCILTENTLPCSAAGANITLGPQGGRFKVTIPTTANAAGTLVNPTSGGNCWVDPNGNLTENNEGNNNCPANSADVVVSTRFLYLPIVWR